MIESFTARMYRLIFSSGMFSLALDFCEVICGNVSAVPGAVEAWAVVQLLHDG